MAGMFFLLHFECHNDGHDTYCGVVCGTPGHRPGERLFHDLLSTVYSGKQPSQVQGSLPLSFSVLHFFRMSPAEKRAIVDLTKIQGTLLGTIVDWATAQRPDKSSYLIPLGIIYVVPSILAVAMFFIPESPRWLILQGRHEEGIKSLKWLRPDGADVVSEAEVIRTAIEKEMELKSSVGIWDMFRDPVNRRRTILAVCGVTLQAASGSMFIIGELTNMIKTLRG